MKTLGLIGGTSWVSTIDYYRLINQMTNERLGGLNSAKLFLSSINFQDFKSLIDANEWERVSKMFIDVSRKLEKSGADAIVICANTPHHIADNVQKEIVIPILHIAEATAQNISKTKINKVLLLGTKFTMEQDFFKKKLSLRGIDTVVPDLDDREFIHENIFHELGKGVFRQETKTRYIDLINGSQKKGVQGVVFGCTEIPMLIKPEDCLLPTFDTTLIHARYAVDFSLSATNII